MTTCTTRVPARSPRDRRLRCLVLLVALLAGPARAGALDLRPDAAGVEVDLLPIVASAAAGKAGGSLQLWAAADRSRIRLVGAHLEYPRAFVPSPFTRTSTIVAVLYDRFVREDYTGPWVGGGAEYWWGRIGLRNGSATASWGTPVATVGAGWVFLIWRGVYLNPWGAAHAPLDVHAVAVGPERHRARAIEVEASLKIGWGRTFGQ